MPISLTIGALANKAINAPAAIASGWHWYAYEGHVRANQQSDDKLFQLLPPYVFAFLRARSHYRVRAFDTHRAVVAFPVNRSISFVTSQSRIPWHGQLETAHELACDGLVRAAARSGGRHER